MYKVAIITNLLTGKKTPVFATTDHPDSSYGQPVWVDVDGMAYCQCGYVAIGYDIDEELTAAGKIGLNIFFLRRAAGLTQDELAERVGITRPQLSRIETARHSASVDTVADILAALGRRLTIEPVE